MKRYEIILIAAFVIIGMAASCGGNSDRHLSQKDTGEDLTAKLVKVEPPIQIELRKGESSGRNLASFFVVVTPLQDIEDVEVTWGVPKGAVIAKGLEISRLSASSCKAGEKSRLDIQAQILDKIPGDPVSVTVKAKINGKWYGAVRAINLQHEEKIESSTGYTDAPMIRK